MAETTNYNKHTSNNPLKKIFLKIYFSTFIKELKNKNIESVLDIGCGEGFILNKIKQEKIGQKWQGIDYSKDAIEIGQNLHPNLNLKQGSIYESGYSDNSFDLVVCTEVLEHLEDPKKAINEILRISKKYVLLSVPNEPLFLLSNFTQWGKDIGHINHWTFFGFEKFVKRAIEEWQAESSEANPTSLKLRGATQIVDNTKSNSDQSRRGINPYSIRIISRKYPFPWTMILVQKLTL